MPLSLKMDQTGHASHSWLLTTRLFPVILSVKLCVYSCVFMHLCVCISVYLCESVYMCILYVVHGYMHLYALYVYVHVCMFVYMHLCKCMYVHVCVHICVYMHMYADIYLCVCMCICAYVHHINACICACVCTRVCVCIWVCVEIREQGAAPLQVSSIVFFKMFIRFYLIPLWDMVSHWPGTHQVD